MVGRRSVHLLAPRHTSWHGVHRVARTYADRHVPAQGLRRAGPRRTRSGGLGPEPHLEDPATSAAVRDRLTVQHGHPAQLPVQPRQPVGAAQSGGHGAPPVVVVVVLPPMFPPGDRGAEKAPGCRLVGRRPGAFSAPRSPGGNMGGSTTTTTTGGAP